MSVAEQKGLWMNLNKKRIADLVEEIDRGIRSENLSEEEVSVLVKEARKKARKKKKVKRSVIDLNTFITILINRKTHWLQGYVIQNFLEINAKLWATGGKALFGRVRITR